MSEDLLTSLVFGLLPHRSGALAGFLARARTLKGDVPLARADIQFAAPQVWPRTVGFGEPDVVIRGRAGDRPITVVVEAKLGAGKTQWGAGADGERGGRRDQLARYWSAWKAEALGPRTPGEECVVVYLTAHLTPPLDDLRESVDASPDDATITWLSWGDLIGVLGSPAGPPIVDVVASHLLTILDSWGFGPFSGFSSLATQEPVGRRVWWFDVGGFNGLAAPEVEANAGWKFDAHIKGAVA